MPYRIIGNLGILALMRQAREIILEGIQDAEAGRLFLCRCPGDEVAWGVLFEDASAYPTARELERPGIVSPPRAYSAAGRCPSAGPEEIA